MKLFFTKNQVYNTHFYLVQYNDNYFKIVLNKFQREKGFEEKDKKHISFSDSDEVERISLSRTKRNIKEICLCNNFEYFCTITINSKYCDRFSLELSQEKLKKILHKIKRKNKDFAFILITEKHKDGAFHFHGMMKNIPLYTNKNGYLASVDLNELGYNSFSVIKNYNKCCNYISKYITKDCIRNDKNQIYISSKGLKKALKYEIMPIDLKWGYENDFVKIKEFSIEELSKDEILNFLKIKEGF